MRTVDIIEAKKDGKELADSDIAAMVAGFVAGEIPDYQMSAFLMAVACRGMSLDETICLTRAMVNSGKILDLSSIPGIKLDKHSSGGVGDKVTLALVPILAAAGVPMAKMSGHGLGHTGGTLDKLESIPGFRTELTEKEIIAQVKSVGACICGQTDTIAPADRLMYALRDVTGSVASIPLIASSIMSKKIACGADAILLDIKVGSGAFMKRIDSARELAQSCQKIARSYGKKITIYLTDMNQPLGRAVGNYQELAESLLLLIGMPSDDRLLELTVAACRQGLKMAGVEADVSLLISSRAARAKWVEIVKAQGGDPSSVDSSTLQRSIRNRRSVLSTKAGYVQKVDALKIGRLAQRLGAGREKKGDKIDHLAGVFLSKVVGDQVKNGQRLATLSSSDTARLNNDSGLDDALRDAYVIGDEPPEPSPIILEIIGDDAP